MKPKLLSIRCPKCQPNLSLIRFVEKNKYECELCQKTFTYKDIYNLLRQGFSEARQKLEDDYLRDISEIEKVNAGEE